MDKKEVMDVLESATGQELLEKCVRELIAENKRIKEFKESPRFAEALVLLMQAADVGPVCVDNEMKLEIITPAEALDAFEALKYLADSLNVINQSEGHFSGIYVVVEYEEEAYVFEEVHGQGTLRRVCMLDDTDADEIPDTCIFIPMSQIIKKPTALFESFCDRYTVAKALRDNAERMEEVDASISNHVNFTALDLYATSFEGYGAFEDFKELEE